MKGFSTSYFYPSISIIYQSFGGSPTWHDSCTFVVTGSLRNRFETRRSELCHTAASIQQPEKYLRPFLSIPMSRCGMRWPPRTRRFEPGRRGLSASVRRLLAGPLKYFSKRRKNSLASPHWKWERESPRAEAKWSL